MNQETGMRRAALVTGGGRGIGRAVCVALAENGCDVAINCAGNVAAAETTAALCRAKGAKALVLPADVRSPETCKALVDKTVEAFGGIDVLVNNAGVTADKLLLQMTEEDFDRVLDTNLKGAFFASKAALRPMLRRRRGAIVNVSSVVALRGNAGQTNYAASKAGLIGLTKSLAREVANRGITVNAVAPGYIETDMTAALPEAARQAALAAVPLGRAGQAEEIAQAVVFLTESRYTTGQVLSVDGGMGI